MVKKVVYVEPADYIPKDLRKKYKLGEYAETGDKEISEATMDEPADYIPKDLRKKYKLGEFAEEKVEPEIKVTVETKNGTLTANGVDGVEKLIEVLNK